MEGVDDPGKRTEPVVDDAPEIDEERVVARRDGTKTR